MTEPYSAGPIRYRRPTEPDRDPDAESKLYSENKWWQQLQPAQTECFYCHRTSPVVYVPIDGYLAFGDMDMVRWGKKRHKIDITRFTVEVFAKLGWKFQLKRAYCPTCKGLGSV